MPTATAAAAAACNAAAQQMLSKHSQALIYRRPCSLPVMLLYLSSQSADTASERARGGGCRAHVMWRLGLRASPTWRLRVGPSTRTPPCSVWANAVISVSHFPRAMYIFFLISLQNEQSISPITDGGYVDHHNLMNLIPLSILDFQLNCINALLA